MLFTPFIYLFFYKHWNLYVSYANHSFLVHSKVLRFFHQVSFFFIVILATISHWRFAFVFFGGCIPFYRLESRSRQQRLWLTRFYHFTSFHNLLFYHWHFTNKMLYFLAHFCSLCRQYQKPLYYSHHNHPLYRNILETS